MIKILKNMGLGIFIYVILLTGERCLADRILDYEYIADAGGWLRLHEVPAPWQDARLRCHLEGGILASPTSSALTEAMMDIMTVHSPALGSMFTGIHATISKGDFMSIDGVPLSNLSLQWANGEPDNLDNDEECLVMTSAGEVADKSCASVYPYICYKDSAKMILNECGNTDKGYVSAPRTGSCYKFHGEARTWHRAAVTCAAERAHLAIINSETESQVLKELLAEQSCGSFIRADNCNVALIGVLDWQKQGEWLTIFGETFEEAGFGVWNGGEPNNAGGVEYCGSVSRNGLLNDVPCNVTKMAFFCEITP